MAEINQEARIPVYINDEQAISKLKELQREAARLSELSKNALGDPKALQQINKEIRKNSQEMNTLKKTSFDVGAVLKNLSSASINDMQKAAAKLRYEMKGVNTNSKEYLDLKKKHDQIDTRIKEVTGKITEQKGAMGKLKDVAAGLLPAFGWAAIAAGAGMAFKKIISATDDLSTKWEIFTSGLSEGMNAFWRTMASGDWSNFFTNIENAIKAGREYAAVMDEIEANQRTMTVAEADALKTRRDLEEKVKNAELSRDERLQAGKDLIKLEEDLASMRTKIAQKGYDNEMMMAMQASKLSKDRIVELIKDFDSGMKTNAEAYLEAKQRLEDITQSEAKVSGMTGVNTSLAPSAEKLKLKAVLDATDEATKKYANDLVKLNNATDNLLDKTVAAYKGVAESENSAYENTARIRTQVHSMTAQQIKEEQKVSEVRIVQIVDETDAIKDEAEALKLMQQSLVEGERMLLEGGEEEFRNLLDNITKYGEILDKELQNIADAAEPIDINFSTPDQLKAFFDARIALIEEQYAKEKEAAMGNHAALLSAESNYNRNVYDLKSQQIDYEYNLVEKKIAAAQSYIASITNYVDQESKLGKALFLFNQALAIGEVWVNIAKANAKAIAISPLTFGQPWVGVNTAQGVVQTGLIAAQTVAKFVKGKKAGGYADSSSSDDQVAGYYHANEFIASAPAVRNPTVKPVLDLIDMAQRSGRVANLNLPAALTGYGRKEGGYAAGSSSGSSTSMSQSTAMSFRDPELNKTLSELKDLLKGGVNAKLYYRDFEEYDKEVKDVRNSANI